MLKTHVQQGQVSGSLSFDDSVSRENLIKVNRTLADDLNSLRTQIKGILGSQAWTDEQAITLKNLKAQLTGALNANNVEAAGTLNVSGKSTFADIVDVNSTLSASAIKIDGDVEQRLYIVDADGSMKDEANMIFDGSTFKVTGAMSGSGAFSAGGSLTVAGASLFNNEVKVIGNEFISGSLEVSGSALFKNGLEISGDFLEVSGSLAVTGISTLEGKVTVNNIVDVNSTLSASAVKIDGDVAQRLYIVDADGSMKDESNLTFNGTTLSVTGASSVSGNASIGGTLGVTGAATLSSTLGVTGLATMSNGLTVNGAAADFNAGVTANSIKIDGDVAQRLYIVDADGSIKDEANMTFDGSTFKVTGAMSGSGALSAGGALTVAGASTLNSDVRVFGNEYVSGSMDVSGSALFRSGLEISGDRLEITGSFAVTGTMNVVGPVKLDGDVAQRLYVVDADGSIKDEPNLVFNGSSLFVTGSAVISSALSVNGGSSFAALTASSMKITGDVAQRLYIVDADGSMKDESKLVFDGSLLSVTGAISGSGALSTGGALTVAGSSDLNGSLDVAGQVDLAAVGVATNVRGLLNVAGVADFNGGITANEMKIDGDTAQRLYIVGASGELKDEAKLVFDGSELMIDGDLSLTGDAIIAGNVQVDGDLRVKGSMTYIDTTNMRVQDAFIYLATGSAGTTDSGIVLHGGAGSGMDLAIAQKGGAGEFIFGKGDRQPDGEGSLAGMVLVPSKMSAIKLGSAEDALSGSLEISGNNIKLDASAAAIVFNDAYKGSSTYSGDFKLAASAAEWTAFQTQYPGKSLLGALGAGGGVGVNFRKKIIKGNNANFSGNVLDISAAGVGSLRSVGTVDADYGLDVYLNGVLLALGASNDYEVTDETHISFNYALNADDVLTIVAKNVA